MGSNRAPGGTLPLKQHLIIVKTYSCTTSWTLKLQEANPTKCLYISLYHNAHSIISTHEFDVSSHLDALNCNDFTVRSSALLDLKDCAAVLVFISTMYLDIIKVYYSPTNAQVTVYS